MKSPTEMSFDELKETVRTWPPFMRPAYGWASASETYYRQRNRYTNELMRRYKKEGSVK